MAKGECARQAGERVQHAISGEGGWPGGGEQDERVKARERPGRPAGTGKVRGQQDPPAQALRAVLDSGRGLRIQRVIHDA